MIFRSQIALLHLKKKEDAGEVVQEAFVRSFTKAPEFADEEHEKAWLIRVTINLCKNQLTSAWKRKVSPAEEIEIYGEDGEQKEILALVMALPTDYKDVIYLHYYQGYRVEELARILGVSVSAVKMRLMRGRKMLKLELEEGE